MLDIKKIRNNPDEVLKSLKRKDNNISIDKILKIDAELKVLTTELNDLQANQNSKSKEIGLLKSKGESAEGTFSDLKVLSEKIKNLEKQQRILSSSLKKELLEVPNIPHLSSPHGADSKDNVIVHENNSNRKFNFDLKNHIDIGTELGILDFEVAAKMSGSGFPLYKGRGALLERALINFMIDYHLKNFNYTEFFTPFLVKPDSAITTGQLPKFSEDMYHSEIDDLWLIPTAEVPITNIHQNEILNENDLPKKYTAYSACFRREAGSYGKDTKGFLRLHQFNKVELVQLVRPEDSYKALEDLTCHAEMILQSLNLKYRKVELCTGDLSFSAAKCYDLEIWAPAEKKWLEVSSCSNFEDFQARRGNIKYRKSEDNKVQFVHTLNGSGLATPRLLVALLETYQNPDGSITIPEPLQDYMKLKTID